MANDKLNNDEKDFLKFQRPQPSPDRDRFKTVFDNGDRTDGFAAKLTPPKE